MCCVNELKRLIKYINATKKKKLRLSEKSSYGKYESFTDADFANDTSDRKSYTGFACFINGGLISWACHKQINLSQSSTESELVAANETAKQARWLNRLRAVFGYNIEKTKIFCDNQGCMSIIMHQRITQRTKHIDYKYLYCCDLAKLKELVMIYVPTETNVADIFTKPLSSIRIARLSKMLGLIN